MRLRRRCDFGPDVEYTECRSSFPGSQDRKEAKANAENGALRKETGEESHKKPMARSRAALQSIVDLLWDEKIPLPVAWNGTL
jgi:hypothetical protein